MGALYSVKYSYLACESYHMNLPVSVWRETEELA